MRKDLLNRLSGTLTLQEQPHLANGVSSATVSSWKWRLSASLLTAAMRASLLRTSPACAHVP